MQKTNFHTHTFRCGHATGTDEQYIQSAIEGGYRVLGFSDHTPWPYRSGFVSDIRMLPDRMPGYLQSLRTLREKYRDRIDIRIGLECEYYEPYIPWLRDRIAQWQLDYVIFGNHHYPSDECSPYFGHHTHSPEMLDRYCECALKGIESGLFACMAHPDLFMRSYPRFDDHCERIARAICRQAKKAGLPLEYNVSLVAWNEAHGTTGFPHPAFWRIAAEEGCTAVIGIDAHDPLVLGDATYYDRARGDLAALGICVTDTISFRSSEK